MKRHKDLCPRIHDWDNLVRAYHKARKDKRSKPNVATFELNWEQHLLGLEQELREGSWQPGAYRTFWIHDPKTRPISAAPFRDRVVHHAICNVIEPVFEPTFIHDSYACRVGKGTHAAVDRYTEFCRRVLRLGGEGYVLKCDLRKFFPSLDHEILLDILARKIGCRRTLDLLRLIVESSNPQEPVAAYFPGDDLFTPHERRRGLPIGNLTSQFFANSSATESGRRTGGCDVTVCCDSSGGGATCETPGGRGTRTWRTFARRWRAGRGMRSTRTPGGCGAS